MNALLVIIHAKCNAEKLQDALDIVFAASTFYDIVTVFFCEESIRWINNTSAEMHLQKQIKSFHMYDIKIIFDEKNSYLRDEDKLIQNATAISANTLRTYFIDNQILDF